MTVEAKSVMQSLRVLGRAPHTIAARLQKSGVRGIPEDPHCCVIAVYLRGEFPGEDVTVLPERITVNGAQVTPPLAFKNLIESFDEQGEPQLQQHRGDCDTVARLEVEMSQDWSSYVVRCDCDRVWGEWIGGSDQLELARAYLLKANGGKA